MELFLAFDKGEATRKDNADRYQIINLTGLTKKGKFSRVSLGTEFTRKYTSYSDLFLHLYEKGLVKSEDAGKPFTFCYKDKNGIWTHAGSLKHWYENQVLFEKDAYLADKPDEDELHEAYLTLVDQQRLAHEKKYTIPFNLTAEFLRQELPIPQYWVYETAPTEEQEHYDFLKDFCKGIHAKVKFYKKTRAYGEHENFAIRVNRLDGYNDDLNTYLTLAYNQHYVDSRYFDPSIRKIIHLLCVRKMNDTKETIDIDLTQLFNLATYYTSYYSHLHNTFKKEVELLKEQLKILEAKKTDTQVFEEFAQKEYVQIDFWGNELPMDYPKKLVRKPPKNPNTKKEVK